MADRQADQRSLSAAAMARRLGVSVRTLARWEAAGRIEAAIRTAGGHRRYADADAADASEGGTAVADGRPQQATAWGIDSGGAPPEVAPRSEDTDGMVAAAREVVTTEAARRGYDPSVGAQRSWYADATTPGQPYRQQTVAVATVAGYQRVGRRLIAAWVRSGGGNPDLMLGPDEAGGPDEFAAWLVAHREGWARATWLYYRQAALWVLGAWPSAGAAIERATAILDAATGAGLPGRGRRTSGRRARGVPVSATTVLVARLLGLAERASGETAAMLVDWIVAGAATGLRPGEWRQSVLAIPGVGVWPRRPGGPPGVSEETAWLDAVVGEAAGIEMSVAGSGPVWLVARSEKHTNGRGNLETRALEISALPPRVLGAVVRMIWRGTQHADHWEDVQRRARRLLGRVGRSLWPGRERSVTLYDVPPPGDGELQGCGAGRGGGGVGGARGGGWPDPVLCAAIDGVARRRAGRRCGHDHGVVEGDGAARHKVPGCSPPDHRGEGGG